MLSRNAIKSILKASQGFSLAEVMVAAGLMGVLSLGVAQIMQNQQKTLVYAETKGEELEIFNRIRILLLDKAACENTFKGVPLGTEIDDIKNSNDL